MTALVAVETVVLVLLTVLVAGLLRSHADILRALHDLGVGPGAHPGPNAGSATEHHVAPPTRLDARLPAALSGTTPGGDAVAIALGGAGDTLLAFLSSGCVTCDDLWADLAMGSGIAPEGARVVAVTKGPSDESVSRVAERAGAATIPVVMSGEAWHAFQVPGAPYFVLVGSDGRLRGEGTANRWSQVVEFVHRARADEAAVRPVHAWAGDDEREARNDRELLAAGIAPGDPRLFFAPDAGPSPTAPASLEP